jgi:hypothetical protein
MKSVRGCSLKDFDGTAREGVGHHKAEEKEAK